MRPMGLDQKGAEDSAGISTGADRPAAPATKVAPLASAEFRPEATGMATVTGRPGGHDVQPDPELDAAGDDLRARLDVISKRFAWDGRRLVINHEPTLTRLTQRTMSASTMHAMDGCTARWAFEKVWPGEQDPFAPSVLGNGGHKVLEKLFELPGQRPHDSRRHDDPATGLQRRHARRRPAHHGGA